MIRNLLTALLLLLFSGSAFAAEPVLVAFTASWCPPCQQMRPIIERLKAAGVDVRKVDCSQPNRTATAYRVFAYPTFVVIRDGVEAGRLSGYCSERTLRNLVRGAK